MELTSEEQYHLKLLILSSLGVPQPDEVVSK